MEWFSVDKGGLAKILERKGKAFVLHELVQNCWDEKTERVWIKINRISGSPFVTVRVSDDNPEGFADLSHAFTLFAESNKKGDVQKRGRFNLGEKLVLALCRKAEIASTKGTIIFDETGRHRSRKTTDRGSIFLGEMKMTDNEMADCATAMQMLIPPEGIETSYQIGSAPIYDVPLRVAIARFEEPMITEVADNDGNMRKSTRKTLITIHTAKAQAYLYEMGIPVVEIDGRYHVNIHQKVPLNFDRDNVTPAYLAKVHALTVEHMQHSLTTEDVNQSWVKVAVQEHGDDLSNETVRRIADLRFGERRVAYDPSDPEANNIAVSKGYQVIHGGSMSREEWDVMRRANAIQPAGQVTPSRPENFEAAVVVPQDKWTSAMHAVAAFCKEIAPLVIGVKVSVLIINNPTASTLASYGSRQITFNMGRLGRKWFEGPTAKVLALIIHEFAHEKSGNHLSEAYYDALTEIGATMAALAIFQRELFEGLPLVNPHICQEETVDA